MSFHTRTYEVWSKKYRYFANFASYVRSIIAFFFFCYVGTHICYIGWFFSYYLFDNTSCTFRVLFHRHQSSVWSIIEFYYQNGCSVKDVHRALLSFYGQFNRPTEATIRAIVTKFRTKFTLSNIEAPIRLQRVRTEEHITAISASANDDHQLSIRE